MTRILVAVLLLAMAGGSMLASAQEDCTEGLVCVDYAGQVLEIDPSDGFLQSIVVEERVLTTKSFDGTMTEHQVKVATFVQDDDTYRLEREDVVLQAGAFEDAELGDTFLLVEAK